jgi:hypothetical protein
MHGLQKQQERVMTKFSDPFAKDEELWLLHDEKKSSKAPSHDLNDEQAKQNAAVDCFMA